MGTAAAGGQGAGPAAIPRDFNFAAEALERNLAAGRADKVAYIDPSGPCSYARLAERVERFGHALRRLDVRREERVLLCLHDTVDWPTAFLGALKAGVVAVPANTLLTSDDYRFLLTHSRARALVVSAALYPKLAVVLADAPDLRHVIVSGGESEGHLRLEDLLDAAPPDRVTAATCRDDIAFWLYTSGSTGQPKAAVHVHADLALTDVLYGRPYLGLGEHDVCYSVAKLFFAYGLGNSLTFPLAAGATTVLLPDRPTPDLVGELLRRHRVTAFFAVPTFYAAFLAAAAAPDAADLPLRRCVSAGEALPPDLGRRFSERYGVEILDGLGSTELLHIFLSNAPGAVRYGTSGTAVPGYSLRLIDDDGREVEAAGEVGELQVSGPTSALTYWNDCERSRATFQGPWTRTGDKYARDAEGYYVYCGRRDDMLKVGGIYVSPFEVEGALCAHPEVLEAAVVGWADGEGLIKPKAFVVLRAPERASPALARELQEHCRGALAPFKYPRWIEFRPDLPKTATGKIQRFRLRAEQPGPTAA